MSQGPLFGMEGQQGDRGDIGPRGPAGVGMQLLQLQTTLRALDTPFQVSATNPASVNYACRLQLNFTLIAKQTAGVELVIAAQQSDLAAAAAVDECSIGASGLIGLQRDETETVAGFVPAGSWVMLRSTGNGAIARENKRATERVWMLPP